MSFKDTLKKKKEKYRAKIKKERMKKVKELLKGIPHVPKAFQTEPVEEPLKAVDPENIPTYEQEDWRKTEAALEDEEIMESPVMEAPIMQDVLEGESQEPIVLSRVEDPSIAVMKTAIEYRDRVIQEKDEVIGELTGQVKSLEARANASASGLPYWEGKKLRVMIPSMKFMNAVTTTCLVALALDFGREKIGFDFEFGDSMIYHARNLLAKRFLESEAEWSLWLDDDMIIPIGRPDLTIQYSRAQVDREAMALHTVTRLMSHNKTLIGATYFGRQATGSPMFYEAQHDLEANMAARNRIDAIRPTRWVGTGCMLVHRSVYLDIQKKHPELAPTRNRPYWDFFMPSEQGGEDVMFCLRATAAGHQPFVDTHLQCLHVGFSAYHAMNTKDGLRESLSAI